MKKLLFSIAALGLMACGTQSNGTVAATPTSTITPSFESTTTPEANTESSNILVVYYSATGSTEKIASDIVELTGADVFVIEPVESYTSEDLNYNNDSSRVSLEHEDENRNVELVSTTVDNWDNYDTVLIGYPIWWGSAAWVVDNFVTNNDFTSKTVIPFCTSASSPYGSSGEELSEMAGTGNWIEGTRFNRSTTIDDVQTWLESVGVLSE